MSGPTSRSCGWPKTVPGRDRRRSGRIDRKWLLDHLPDGRFRASGRSDVGVVAPSACGVRAPGTSSSSTTEDDVSQRGVRVRHVPVARRRDRARARLADLVRRRARVGAVRPDRAGRPAVGHVVGGGTAARRAPRRRGRLPHHRAGWRRATARTATSSSSSTTSSRAGWPGRRSRTTRSSVESLPAAAGRRTGDGPVHADGRRPDLLDGDPALHAGEGADPDPRRRSDRGCARPALVRDECGVRAVGREAPPHVVPAAGAGAGRERARRRVLRRAAIR